MPPIGLARRPAVRPAGRAARAGLVLLVALASLSVVSRLQVPPTVRTTAVGRVPTAVAVDAHTRRVFVANLGSNTVSMLDATSGAVLATISVSPHPSALAVATTAGRVFAVSDDVTLDDAGRVSVLDATSGRRLRTTCRETTRVAATAVSPPSVVVVTRPTVSAAAARTRHGHAQVVRQQIGSSRPRFLPGNVATIRTVAGAAAIDG